MDTQTDVYDFDVLDATGSSLGSVDGVWLDNDTNHLEFVSVKTGWLMGKSHIIPTSNASIQTGSRSISVAYAQDKIKDAPTIGSDEDISPEQEAEIYDYYRLARSTNRSPSGLPRGENLANDSNTDRINGDVSTDREMTLSEEELQVGKQQVETGRVRLRKVINTERVEQPVELRHEEVNIERLDASDADIPSDAFQEKEIEVPVRDEEPVVGKETHVAGKVGVSKDVTMETRSVGGQVRREDVEVDEDASANSGFNRG